MKKILLTQGKVAFVDDEDFKILSNFKYGENKNLGRFKDEVDAANAYDKAALIYFGEFVKTNFPRKINE